jgi:hypothetical protein
MRPRMEGLLTELVALAAIGTHCHASGCGPMSRAARASACSARSRCWLNFQLALRRSDRPPAW